MKLNFLFTLLAVLILGETSMAMDWHGIVPLKSTRADVERLFGKPDKWGDYQINAERVSFRYSEGPCRELYQGLGRDDCKCLVDKDTVMSIYVEPTIKRRFSDLKLDMAKFSRIPIAPYPNNFSYSNPTEGVDYEIDESEDAIRDIEYYPSPIDCQSIVNSRANIYRNSWRGLVPLHASQRDVERLLGLPKRAWETAVAYETDHEIVTVKYSNGKCSGLSVEWNVPDETVLELVVNPRLSFLLGQLNLDSSRYERQERPPLPEIASSPKVVNYINDSDGITIRSTQSRDGGEETVVSITYRPARKDETLRCNNNVKLPTKKP
jgi:hypothetical protein